MTNQSNDSPRRRRKPKRKLRKCQDETGRFKPGFSGNPKGRGAKRIELPQHLCFQLADAMATKISIAGHDGKRRKVCAYDLAAQRLVEFIATANLKDLMAILGWLEKLGVFYAMRDRAEKEGAEVPVSKRDREFLAKWKPVVAEAERKTAAQEMERMQRSKKNAHANAKGPRTKAG